MACHQLDGGKPESKVLPTRFIMRRSASGSKKNAENTNFYHVRDFDANFMEISYKTLWAKQTKTEERNELLGDIQKEKMRENYDMKLFVQDILQFEKGKDQSYGVLLENLNWLSIENADVYLLEKPVLHLFLENFQVPEVLYHKATLRKGVVSTIPVVQQQEAFHTVYDRTEEDYCYRQMKNYIW